MRCAATCVLALSLTAVGLAQETVGTSADRIDVRGCTRVDPEDVVLALERHPEWRQRAAAGASRAELFAFIERAIAQGFANYGCPDAKVSAMHDAASDAIVVDVVEGPLVVLASVEVSGNRAVDTETIRKTLGATPGKSIAWSEVAFRHRWDLVRRVYSRAGYPVCKCSVDMVREEGTDTADLRVVVADEGPQSEIAAIELIGDFSDDREKLLARAAIPTGESSRGITLQSVHERFMAIGRYAKVDFDATTWNGAVADPLRVRLTQADVPAWDDLDQDEVTAFQRMARGLARPGADEHVVLRVRTSAPLRVLGRELAPGATFECSAASDAYWLRWSALRLGEETIGPLSVTAVDDVVELTDERARRRASVVSHGRSKVAIDLGFAPSGEDLPLQTRWAISYQRHGAEVPLRVAIHDAVLGVLHETSVRTTDDAGDAVFTTGGASMVWSRREHALTLAPSAAAIEFRVALAGVGLAARLRAERAARGEYREARAIDVLDDAMRVLPESAREPARLALIAAGVSAERLLESLVGGDSKAFVIVEEASPDSLDALAFAVLGPWLRPLEGAYAHDSWPAVVLSGLRRARWHPTQRVVRQLNRQVGNLDEKDLGPLAYSLLAETLEHRKWRVSLAKRGLQSLRGGDRCADDVLALFAPESLRPVAAAIGAAWRDAGLAGSKDVGDLEAFELGLRRELEPWLALGIRLMLENQQEEAASGEPR